MAEVVPIKLWRFSPAANVPVGEPYGGSEWKSGEPPVGRGAVDIATVRIESVQKGEQPQEGGEKPARCPTCGSPQRGANRARAVLDCDPCPDPWHNPQEENDAD